MHRLVAWQSMLGFEAVQNAANRCLDEILVSNHGGFAALQEQKYQRITRGYYPWYHAHFQYSLQICTAFWRLHDQGVYEQITYVVLPSVTQHQQHLLPRNVLRVDRQLTIGGCGEQSQWMASLAQFNAGQRQLAAIRAKQFMVRLKGIRATAASAHAREQTSELALAEDISRAGIQIRRRSGRGTRSYSAS